MRGEAMNFFRKERLVVDVYGARDHQRIPEGYFLCESASGRGTIGHNGPNGLYWQITRPATLSDEQLRALPVIRLHIAQSQAGVVQMAGHALVDSASLDSFGGDFGWDGSE
jgi:hypothetical protein